MEIKRTNFKIKFTDSSFDSSSDLNQQLNRNPNQTHKTNIREGDYDESSREKMLSDFKNDKYLTKIFKKWNLNLNLNDFFSFKEGELKSSQRRNNFFSTNQNTCTLQELLSNIFEPKTGNRINQLRDEIEQYEYYDLVIYFIDLLFIHGILHEIEQKEMQNIIIEEYNRVALIEQKCYWDDLYVRKIFYLTQKRYDQFRQRSNVLGRRSEVKGFEKFLVDYEPKHFAKLLIYVEALKFTSLNIFDLFGNNRGANKRDEFIYFYNRLTHLMISKVLETENLKDQRRIVKWILKVGKIFASEGAMNGLNACITALQCNSVYRLNVIGNQEVKYQNRYATLSDIVSPVNNFAMIRQTETLVPWMGLLMKDFAFIKELKTTKDEGKNTIHFELGNCFIKVVDSVFESQRTCRIFLTKVSEKQLQSVTKLIEYIESSEIIYESEEVQFSRSQKLLWSLDQ